MRKFPMLLFGALLVAAAWRVSVLAGSLPAMVAVHFNAAGRPDGFTSREDCRQFMRAFTLGAPAFCRSRDRTAPPADSAIDDQHSESGLLARSRARE